MRLKSRKVNAENLYCRTSASPRVRGTAARPAETGEHQQWEYAKSTMEQQKEARPVRRRARGIQRMASILDAAETVFSQVGYAEANTHQIADAAGVSPGSLYQFFSNKEEIAQALALRYAEELQRIYSVVFAAEAATLPVAQWLDQIVDALITFHLGHPAFHVLFDAPPSLEVASMTQQLPEELQARFEHGFRQRAPAHPHAQQHLSAILCVQLFKSVLPLILRSADAEREPLVRELKSMLQRYVEPLLVEVSPPSPPASNGKMD